MSHERRVVSIQHYPEFGGPHNEILKLEPRLNARGVRTIVVLTDQPGSARERLEGAVDLEVMPLERFRTSLDPCLNGRTLIHLKRDIDALRSVIRRHEADVVKVHGPHNPHGAIAARLEGVPVVWVLSSTRPSAATRRLGMTYVRRLADALLVNGRSLATFYPGADALADRSFYYYPPIDCQHFAPPSAEERAAARRALDLPPDAEVVATVANITPQKGIEFFVSAAALIKERRPETRFLVVGGVNPAQQGYFDRVQRIAASLDLPPDDLRFLGVRSDVNQILRAVDVKVIASRAEGTTATAGEAMACGVPVVATNVGAVSEVVEHELTGLLVPALDAAAIAEATISLLGDPAARQRMGEAGRQRAQERFGLDSCADVHVDAYRCAADWHARRRTPTEPLGSASDGGSMQHYQELAHQSVHGCRSNIAEIDAPSPQPSNDLELRDLLVCPVCRGALAWSAIEARCAACDRRYPVVDGIPHLLLNASGGTESAAGLSAHKRHQIEFYAGEDPEYEISRPHGTPRFYTWLLAEKSRRSLVALGDLRGRTVLTVCAGSGMDSEFLARTGARVIASDLSLEAARRTAERARRFGVEICPVVADVERLPFADRAVDVAYVHDGLHHLEDPWAGLGEMARVAATAVSVTEPCDAAVTRLAVRARLADAVEEAGNRVVRLRPEGIVRFLEQRGFGAVHVDRYAMYYKHRPGPVMRALSTRLTFPLARAGWKVGNAVLGPLGNKIAVQATRVGAGEDG